MSKPTIHDAQTAPEEARETLEGVTKAFGFIPNILGLMAESPAALKAYVAIDQAFKETSLSPIEQQTVLLSVAHENACQYCMAAHSWAFEASGGSSEDLKALRAGEPVGDSRLRALQRLTTAIVRERGWISEGAIEEFTAAGWERKQIQEVLVGVTQKTLSNYTNHIFGTPLDDALSDYRWEAGE